MIEKQLYAQIHSLMPIACVDLVIVRNGRILLVRRNREPVKGQFFFPGGRIMRNESFANAIKRIAKDEVGLEVSQSTHLGSGALMFETDPFGHGHGTHTVSFIFRCISENGTPNLDQNHNEYIWWDGSSGEYHPYVKNFASKAKATEGWPAPNVDLNK